ncbi:MAG: autotransporter domain-containing protein [Proteobacteria bacterium]|nr:autotransporter domain-containing protein [Pseudomonadota bacterium]
MFSQAPILRRDGAAAYLIAAGMALSALLLSPSPARADCSTSGTTVTCSSTGGPQTTTVGTGAENNLTVNVLTGASIAVGSDTIGIFLNGQNVVTNGGAISAGDAAGSFSGGVFFAGDGNTAINNGSITVGNAVGGQVFGIQSYGLNADVTNNGSIVIGNGSGIVPYPIDATGISVYNDSRITNNGSIVVGNYAQAIFACCGNQITNSANALIEAGNNGVGIFAGADNNQITNAGRIVAGNGSSSGPIAFAYGVLLSGRNNTVTNTGSITVGNIAVGIAIDDPAGGGGPYGGNKLINAAGAVITAGDGSYGMASGSQTVTPANATLTNNGTIVVGNAIPSVSIPIGMIAFGRATITNTGVIIAGNGDSTTFPVGIYALKGNSTIVNSGSITVGTAGLGIRAAGDGTTLNNSGTISVGAGGTGIQITFPTTGTNVTGPAVTNSGTVIAGTGGTGVNFVDNGSLINTGSIRAYGDGSGSTGYGIFTCSCTTTVITNSGTLDGKIQAEGPSTTFVNSGLIAISDTNAVQPIGPFNFNISDFGHAGGGSFTQTASGILSMRVMPGATTAPIDSLLADTIVLAGTLRVALQPGLYASRTITDTAVSLTNSGASRITTTFNSFLVNSPFFTVTPIYDTGDATSYTAMSLQLDRTGFGALPGLTPNQKAVGDALERGYSPSLDPSSSVGQFYENLLLNGSAGFYDQLSGAGTAASQDAAFNVADLFSAAMLQQAMAWLTGGGGAPGVTFGGLGYAPAGQNKFANRPGADAFAAMRPSEGRWRVWGAGFGATRSIDGQWGTADKRVDAGGGLFGVDREIAPDLLIGGAVGASTSRFSVSGLSTSGHSNAGHVGVYALKTFGAAYLAGALHYAHANNDTDRTISGIGTTETAKGSFDSDQFGGRLELGWRYALRSMTLTPFAAIAPVTLWQQGYSENSTTSTGAPGVLGLTYQSNRVSSFPSFLGLQVDGRFAFDNGLTLSPFVRASWVHEFDTTRSISATFINIPGGSFTAEGASAAANALRLEGGASLALNERTSLFASLNSELSSRSTSFAGMGGLRFGW